MIKVLELIQPTTGGSIKYLKSLVKHIDNPKFKILIGCPLPEDNSFITQFKNLKAEVIIINMRREINIIRDFISFIKIYRLIKNENPDVVHTHCSKAGFLGRIAAKIACVPLIIHNPHGFYFEYPIRKISKKFFLLLEKFAGRFTDYLIAVCKTERDSAVSNKILSEDRVLLVPTGIDINEYQRSDKDYKNILKIEEGDYIIGMIGRLSHPKDPFSFIRAIPMVLSTFQNTKFLIVGDGELKESSMRLTKSLNISSKVLFLGYQSHIGNLYSIIDICVLSSKFESFPIVVLEAMLFSKPIIATDVGGCKDIIVNGKSGFLIPPNNPEIIAEKIITLLKEPELLRKMGEVSKRIILENYRIDIWIKKIQKIYEKAKTPKI